VIVPVTFDGMLDRNQPIPLFRIASELLPFARGKGVRCPTNRARPPFPAER
jgi:hypothetical protein